MSRSKFTYIDKLDAVTDFLEGRKGAAQIQSDLEISDATLYTWVVQFREQGLECFTTTSKNKSYSKEFKEMVVNAYLNGEGSSYYLASKYNLRSKTQLLQWVKLYNSYKELKDYNPKQEVYMAEAKRNTTKEERIEIVEYCVDHKRDYKGMAEKFHVSYSQVYSWVKKYDSQGEEGLNDRRGQHKSDEEVDELERLRRENKRLKRQLEEEKMMVELLKKVKEFERRRYSPKEN
jgi:transposase-like protein